MYRYELTDMQGEQPAPFFSDCSHQGQAGHPWQAHRPLVNGILWRLHAGAPWADVPERYRPWKTVYDRFNRWRKDGAWAKIPDTLLLRLDRAGLIDREPWLVDASVIRASGAAPVAPPGGGRQGLQLLGDSSLAAAASYCSGHPHPPESTPGEDF